MMIEVHINGEPKQLATTCSVADMLVHLNIKSRAIAIECNGEIVTRENYPVRLLKAGDQIEVVTLAGGG